MATEMRDGCAVRLGKGAGERGGPVAPPADLGVGGDNSAAHDQLLLGKGRILRHRATLGGLLVAMLRHGQY